MNLLSVTLDIILKSAHKYCNTCFVQCTNKMSPNHYCDTRDSKWSLNKEFGTQICCQRWTVG